jgi:hypothetical protein
MDFKEPLKVYTAETNLEAHMIVEMLEANGIAALVEEDRSGVSLWAFGTIGQFHQPNIWIEKSSAQAAATLICRFEEQKRERATPSVGGPTIRAQCEECGKEASFAENLDGTVQECPHCGAYIDVGQLDWDDDFGVAEE